MKQQGRVRRAGADIVVRSLSRRSRCGVVEVGWIRFVCALGRSGRVVRKAEGDGGTPVGVWRLRAVRYRPDHGPRPVAPPDLPLRATRPADGWCDGRGDRNYNRAVQRPYAASTETMWRDDGLYDLVVILDHNERPRKQGGGSAIFMHVARPGLTPTEGCVALPAIQLRRVLSQLRHGARLRVVL
jgi:L,D-peptidoglycan transpeptidase YkuD (ErfK/YbiS/YcfS/YnhG family)